MRVGTKSVLFGVHCFLIHPFFIAAGWLRTLGVPWDLRLWVAFLDALTWRVRRGRSTSNLGRE
jgi:hypothetical protein